MTTASRRRSTSTSTSCRRSGSSRPAAAARPSGSRTGHPRLQSRQWKTKGSRKTSSRSATPACCPGRPRSEPGSPVGSTSTSPPSLASVRTDSFLRHRAAARRVCRRHRGRVCRGRATSRGVVLCTNIDDVYIGDTVFEPLRDALDDRAATVLIHPTAPERLPGTAPERPRDLLPRGRVPALHRLPLRNGRQHHPRQPHRRRLLTLMRRFSFDTARSSGPTTIPSLLAFAHPTHTLFGSDYPHAAGQSGDSPHCSTTAPCCAKRITPGSPTRTPPPCCARKGLTASS